QIRGKVRISFGVMGGGDSRSSAVRDRLATRPANLVPARAGQPKEARIAQFVATLEGQGATVAQANDAEDVPELIADYLREKNLPAEVRSGTDADLGALPWDRTPSLERRSGPAEAHDGASLSRAVAGAAETGTLFLTSGPENPTTLNFLPDTHIAVIKAGDIGGSYEEAWERLRAQYGPRTLPRAVNMISGPSRTADIEQTIIMGAHGPRRLHVIIVA
ncbi:MAG: LutC/YkgG family protein, partial [Methyloligellaceae bacterium]